MDTTKPLTRWPVDETAPCPSDYAWVAHRSSDMAGIYSNIICEGCDCIIATGLSNRAAMEIVDAHNGTFTPHSTDGYSLIHETQ